jgi:cytochrome c
MFVIRTILIALIAISVVLLPATGEAAAVPTPATDMSVINHAGIDWITDPQHLLPGNEMTFAGIKDARQRSDLLAFLKEATQPGATVAQQGGPMGGMAMMGGQQVPNLKELGPEGHVQEVTYCKDTYTVTTANGQTRKFWERNLRLMTDESDRGPGKNAPVIVAAGMMGDRADVIFADPSEISPFIANKC